eukprot:scaffold28984_cov22-Tisochrysis_lutea.AAC.1
MRQTRVHAEHDHAWFPPTFDLPKNAQVSLCMMNYGHSSRLLPKWGNYADLLAPVLHMLCCGFGRDKDPAHPNCVLVKCKEDKRTFFFDSDQMRLFSLKGMPINKELSRLQGRHMNTTAALWAVHRCRAWCGFYVASSYSYELPMELQPYSHAFVKMRAPLPRSGRGTRKPMPQGLCSGAKRHSCVSENKMFHWAA